MLEIILALLAGVLTVASPCILPILPVLLGTSLGKNDKLRPIFIVLGFVVSFTFTALILSLLAQNAGLNPSIIRNLGIFILLLFGVLLIWPKPFEVAMQGVNPLIAKMSVKVGVGNTGRWSALLLGLALGLVWTPCAGPVLASILVLIALQKDLLASAILLVAYALGAGVPMLVIAYGGQYVGKRAVAFAKYSRILEAFFGIIIIALAILLFLNYDTKIYLIILQYFPVFNPKL